MLTPDSIVTAFMEAQALLQHARPDQLHELARLLACEVAYCRRYGETLPLGELVQRSNRLAPPDSGRHSADHQPTRQSSAAMPNYGATL